MDFFRGFVIWGIVALVVGAICFILWKFYFCRVRGFENRKNTTLVGCILIFISTIAYLFLPLVLCKAPLFKQTKDRFIDGIKNDIVAKTRDAFYEDAERVLSDIVYSSIDEVNFDELEAKISNELGQSYSGVISGDIGDFCVGNISKDILSSFLTKEELAMVGNSHDNVRLSDLSETLGAELERAKENVVKYAVKYSKNRTLKDSLNNAFKLLKVGDYNFNALTEDDTFRKCNKIVDQYSADIKNNYIKNSLMKPWINPIVKNVSMKDLIGDIADEAKIRAFNKAKRAFDILFLLIATCISIVTAIVIFLILYLLREEEDNIEIKYKRNHMFEYNEKSFEDMNAKKI